MSLDDDSFLWPDGSGAAVQAPAAEASSKSAGTVEAPLPSTADDDGFLWPAAVGAAALEPTLSQGSAVVEQPAAAGDHGNESFLFPEEPGAAAPQGDDGDGSSGGDESESSEGPAWNPLPGPRDPGSLAAKVMNLRVLEDEIAALLDETERALRSLESERTLEDAGFPSAEEFRERVSAQMGLLAEMREPRRRAPAATGRVRRRAHNRARGGDTRARRTLALTAIEQTMTRFRELDLVMRGKVEEARDLLADIDRERTFAECGYASFAEFLELAIGPSPILTKCLTVLGEFPPPARRKEIRASQGDDDELPSFADPPGPRPSDDRPPALFELPADSSAEPAPAPAPGAPVTAGPAKSSRRRLLPPRSALVVSIALGIAAAAVGAVAGVRVSHPAPALPVAAEAAVAPGARPPAPPGPHPSAAPQPPEPRRGPMAELTSLAPASSVRHAHDERPALTPAPASSSSR